MGKKRSKEEALVHKIAEFKKMSRVALRETFLREREEGHKRGMVFFSGLWLPGDKIAFIQKNLKRRDLTVYIEVIIFLVLVNIFSAALWTVFDLLLLP